jgi:transposase
LGLWDRLLQKLQQRAVGKLYAIDSTYVRVNQSGANPAGGQAEQQMGPSRGGLTTKVHAMVDGRGRPVVLVLGPGNIADSIKAAELFARFKSKGCTTILGDKGYDSDALRCQLYQLGILPCLAATAKRIEKRPFHRGLYRRRHRVENFFCTLKKHRRVSTRYDKLASSFLGFVCLASILHWLG